MAEKQGIKQIAANRRRDTNTLWKNPWKPVLSCSVPR